MPKNPGKILRPTKLMRHVALPLLGVALLAGCEQTASPPVKPIAFELPDPQSAGAQLFQANCTVCHAAPRPDSRTREQWPGIVERMQNHRVVTGYGGILEPELKRILEYLQYHAKQ